jgi:hypothetical protein
MVNAVDFPPDASHDEIALQLLECRSCGLLAAAIYAENRRGQDEHWSHQAARIGETDWIVLRDGMLAHQRSHGPKRAPPSCPELGVLRDGIWHAPAPIEASARWFPIQLKQSG